MSEMYREQTGAEIEKNEKAGGVCKKSRRLICTIIAGLGLIGLVEGAIKYVDCEMDGTGIDECGMDVINNIKKSLVPFDEKDEKINGNSPQKPEIKPTPKPSKTEQPTRIRIDENFDDEPDTSIA